MLAVGMGLASGDRNVLGILLVLLPQAGLVAAVVAYRVTWLRRLRRGDDVRIGPPVVQVPPDTAAPRPRQLVTASLVAIATFALVLAGGGLLLDDERHGVTIFVIAFISTRTVTGAYNRRIGRRTRPSA